MAGELYLYRKACIEEISKLKSFTGNSAKGGCLKIDVCEKIALRSNCIVLKYRLRPGSKKGREHEDYGH